jgi:stress response protein YsnF
VAVTANAGAFQEGEIARMEVFEESVDIRKEAFVREEVNVKKIVEKETATGEEQLRRERLEVTSDGKAFVQDDARAAVKAR